MAKPDFTGYACPVPLRPGEAVVLGHGSGGTLSRDLLRRLFLPALGETAPRTLDDAALVELDGRRIAFTTDAHVVSPLFFPGGDIGRLAVCGTVNDLAMVGAAPLALSAAFVVEEGLGFDILEQVVHSMRVAAGEAGVYLAAGDTKVVPRGSADRLFITTAAIGGLPNDVNISGANAAVGDAILISGTLGDHGIAVLSAREELDFKTDLQSDVAPLNHLVAAMLQAGDVHALRDPTRGGLATALVEIAEQAQVVVEFREDALPIRPQVRAACELLGFDPLHVANEGKLVAFVPQAAAERILEAMRGTRYGEDSCVIGTVVDAGRPQVRMRTAIGGVRLVDMLPGEMLPRIC